MITLLLAALQALTPLSQLARDIAIAGVPVVIIRNPSDPAPEGASPVLAAWLADPGFRDQLAAAHALSINLTSPVRVHAIVFNPKYEVQYAGFEQELLAHELGHIWLAQTGFPGLPYPANSPRETACLAIQAADIPQHEILRRQMHRRGIPYDGYWQHNLTLAADAMGMDAAPGIDDCARMIAVSQWLDLRLGTPFNDGPRVEAAFRARFPALLPVVDRLETPLRSFDVETPEGYRRAVRIVHAALAQR